MKRIFEFVIVVTLITLICGASGVCVLAINTKDENKTGREAITYIMNCANNYGEFYAEDDILYFVISDEYKVRIYGDDNDFLVLDFLYVTDNVYIGNTKLCKCSVFSVSDNDNSLDIYIDDNKFTINRKVGVRIR